MVAVVWVFHAWQPASWCIDNAVGQLPSNLLASEHANSWGQFFLGASFAIFPEVWSFPQKCFLIGTMVPLNGGFHSQEGPRWLDRVKKHWLSFANFFRDTKKLQFFRAQPGFLAEYWGQWRHFLRTPATPTIHPVNLQQLLRMVG